MVSEILGFSLNIGVGHGPRESPAGVTGCVFAQGTRIYMVKEWAYEGFLRY